MEITTITKNNISSNTNNESETILIKIIEMNKEMKQRERREAENTIKLQKLKMPQPLHTVKLLPHVKPYA